MKKIVLGTLVLGVAAFAAVNLGACKNCHGANFEKKALGKSKIVSDMTKADVSASLVGYKAGTYGGPMKGVMKGQVAKYSDDELKATGLGK
jgi:cytochrome c-type protein NapB